MLSYTEFPQNRYGIHVRLVDEGDAEFIVMLRTDSRLGKYISSTDNDVDKQKNWIKAYKSREIAGLEYYFIFEKPLGNRLGVSRIYNIAESTFETGSWVFKRDAPFGAAFLGDIICHEIAFELFPDKVNIHDIKKDNFGVNKYAEEFHPILISETDDQRRFKNTKENYTLYKDQYLKKLLPLVERFDRK